MSQVLSRTAQGIAPRLQFRLRSLVVGISIVAVALAPVRAEMARCQAIQSLADQIYRVQGEIYFDYQLIEEGVVLRQLDSNQPGWIRSSIGAHAFANVVEIHLDGKPADPTVFTQIGSKCPKLLTLTTRNNNTGDFAFEAISQCKTLKYLDVSGTKITDEGLGQLEGHQTLETLCVENAPLNGSCFAKLAKLKSLRILALNHTHVDDNDIAKLADSASIEMLFIAGTEVTDAIIPHLARMKSLNSISFGQTKVSAEGRRQLRELRPEISQS